MRRRTNKIMLVINKNIMYYLSTEYWDKQQEELQEKWRKERERGFRPPATTKEEVAKK